MHLRCKSQDLQDLLQESSRPLPKTTTRPGVAGVHSTPTVDLEALLEALVTLVTLRQLRWLACPSGVRCQILGALLHLSVDLVHLMALVALLVALLVTLLAVGVPTMPLRRTRGSARAQCSSTTEERTRRPSEEGTPGVPGAQRVTEVLKALKVLKVLKPRKKLVHVAVFHTTMRTGCSN